ncbi:hypothetical protein [Nonomuraea aurantiaca]|jgi:hypothetical protein|uniref:hypothetical protein n=1 Tax=Nonomuraea aurantiaca TaxID=2878562 RepID=UPI001CD95691|nr:hypothetical protein [Nonomuraea aurantiaca]MCA2224743.1 hypothetical protein [Nonomuraea aurantiaca]
MANSSMPSASPQPAEVRCTGTWLQRHGLGDGPPTPLLTTRLAVRRRARLLGSVLLAALYIAAALAQATDLMATAASGGLWPRRPTLVLILSVLIIGLVLARMLLDAWVRRVDRQAGAALARRAAHPVQLGWRTLLGWRYAVLVAGTFAGASALGVSALTVDEGNVRYTAVVLLVAVAGVGLGVALQLRELLARPVVAEDEVSLTADVIMRIEDARDGNAPSVLLGLPVVLLLGSAPGWWNVASLGFMLLGLAAVIAVQARTPSCADTARHVVGL